MSQNTIGKIIMTVFCLFFLTGCGKENTDPLSAKTDDKETQKDYVYVAETVELASPKPVQCICSSGDTLYLITYDEETKDNRGFVIDCLNRKSKPFRLPLESSNQSEVQKLAVDNEGNLVFIEKYIESEEKASFLLKTISAENWSLLSTADITDVIGEETLWIMALLIDKDGNYYLVKNKEIMVLSPQRELLFTSHPNIKWFMGMNLTKDGQAAFLAPSADDTKGNILGVLDAKEKGVVQSYEGIEGGNAEGGLAPGTDSDLLVDCNGAVYQYNLQDGSMQEELRWTESMINSSEVRYFIPLSDGNFVAVLSQSGKPGKIAYLTKTPRSEVPQKEKLVLATTAGYNTYLSELVNYFNSQSTDYYVEIKEYSTQVTSAETYDQLKTEMVLDILSGDAPDILDAQAFDTSWLAAKGGIEDLTPWLENDPDLGNVEFFESVLNMHSVDGKMYSITNYFRINTLAAKKEDVGEISNMTLEQFEKLAEEYSGELDFIGIRKESLPKTIVDADVSKWINWETGECNFDSEEFKEVLEFSKKYGQESVEQAPDGPVVSMLESAYFFNALDYKALNIILGGEPVLVGYPVAEDSKSNGARLDCVQKFMICANSDKKEGAWEFIKCFLMPEYYDLLLETQPDQMCFPSRIDIYNQVFDEWMATETITDENGVEKTVGKYEYNGMWWRFGREPITEEDRQVVTELIENASGGEGIRGDIWTILDEELAPYFLGQKSADEVAKIIQSRVQLYVNEIR